jgi:signal transduction histidine kinase
MFKRYPTVLSMGICAKRHNFRIVISGLFANPPYQPTVAFSKATDSQAEDLRNINESLQKANIKIKQKNALIEEKNEDLTRLNNEKNHISILAHDLRNPLATAISMNEPIQSQHNELSEEQYEAGSIIRASSESRIQQISKSREVHDKNCNGDPC